MHFKNIFQSIKLLSHMGLAIGPQAVSRKKAEFEVIQRTKMNNIVKDHVKECQLQYKIDKCKTCLEVLPADDTTPSNKEPLMESPPQLPSNEVTTTYQTGISNVCTYSSYTVAKSKQDHVVFSNNYSSSKECPVSAVLPAVTLKTQCSSQTFEFPPVSPLFDMKCQSGSHYAQAESKTTKKILQGFISKHSGHMEIPVPRFEIIGDNLDLTISPTAMTKERQRKSIHWFLNIALCKRVLSDLPNDKPKADILKIPNSVFIPNLEDCASLEQDMVYHIVRILCDHIHCLKQFRACIPDCIEHRYMNELSKESEFRVIDLLDKSENKSEDMISILQSVHKYCVAHSDEVPPTVIERVVFGGDVLTNERAYSAQLAMHNAESDFFGLAGVIHRPEGLHRMMNFLSV